MCIFTENYVYVGILSSWKQCRLRALDSSSEKENCSGIWDQSIVKISIIVLVYSGAHEWAKMWVWYSVGLRISALQLDMVSGRFETWSDSPRPCFGGGGLGREGGGRCQPWFRGEVVVFGLWVRTLYTVQCTVLYLCT